MSLILDSSVYIPFLRSGTRNDVLIALSARRAGAAVVTANVRDFLAIQRLVRVTVVSVDRLISRSGQG